MLAYAQSSEFKADPSKPISACTWHREPSAAAGKQSTIAIEQIFKCLDCVSFVNCLGTSGDTGLAASRVSSLASNSEGIGMSRLEQLLKQQQAIAEAIDAETRKDRDEALATVRGIVKRHALTPDEVFMSVGDPEVNGRPDPPRARPTKGDATARAARGLRAVSISAQTDTASEIDALERLATALDGAAAYKLGKIFADKKTRSSRTCQSLNGAVPGWMPRCSSIICCGPAASGNAPDARSTAAGIRNDSGSFGADPFCRPKLDAWEAA